MAFTAFMLNRGFTHSLDSAEHEALFAQIYALLALAEPESTGLSLPRYLANPRFETAESGLYARVLDANQDTIWSSNSLLLTDLSFPLVPFPEPGESHDRFFSIGQQDYRSLSFTTVWELHANDRLFNIEIIHNQHAKRREISHYQRALILWLGGIALLLIITQIVVMKWGLRPLKQLASDIDDIEQGTKHQINTAYPKELAPLTASLNKLIDSENTQQQRYKNALADLAHSLKTPLAVIRSQLGKRDAEHTIDEQIERMSNIVAHQLKRASSEVRTVYSPQQELFSVTLRLCNAMGKIYENKNIDRSIDIDPALKCTMQENDLMEVLGNLIENAYKYTSNKIVISARQKDQTSLEMRIEDNGPGIPDPSIHQVLERGARADTGHTGQGLGLAVAVDVLSSYNSGLKIERSESLGGARITLELPTH
jgi:two-component system sensor histidine kinase PhoQ